MLSDRIRNLDLPVFGKISALASGKSVIRLDEGAPDFPAPAAVKEAAAAAIAADYNQYAPVQGMSELRQGIARRIEAREAAVFDPDTEITVCCGATEGITAALLTVINPGDEVILFEPAFALYAAGVVLCGGKPSYVQMRPPEFQLEREALEAAISPQTKAIIVNSPHNPSGRVYSAAELAIVADACLRHQLIAITDEIYEEITFDDIAVEKLWKFPGMRQRTIVVSGFSKTYSVTGWRLGYVLAPAPLSRGILLAHSYLTVGTAAPLQFGAISATGLPASYYQGLAAMLQTRRDFLQTGLEQVGFCCRRPQGGYFIIAECGSFGWPDDWSLARHLIEAVGVAAIPLSGFYKNYPAGSGVFLRFAFCKQEDTLRAAIERLQHLKPK
jgi:aminotransferase